MAEKTRMGIVGLGGVARYHLRDIFTSSPDTEVCAICEPSQKSLDDAKKIFSEFDRKFPHSEPELDTYLRRYAAELDAVFILTPHVFHCSQAKKCLEAGLDVLVEKPMVMNAEEAMSLIDTRDRTGKLLVVGFQGGLSPAIR